MMDPFMPVWRRNLYVISVAELMAIVGFSVVLPFVPFYVQELGVTDPEQVKLWSGLLIASQAITMAAAAPVWGALADRYGRKLMVERAMFGGALVIGAMGFVWNAPQLLLLRAIQGCITGTVPAATTLIASSVPRDRAGSALGLLQLAVWTGASAGPLLGGLIADVYGYRVSFWVTGVLLFAAGVAVHFLVHERFQPAGTNPGQRERLRDGLLTVLHTRPLLVAFGVQLLTRTGSRVTSPVLPLFIQSLVLDQARVASVTGLASGISAATGALAAVGLGRMSDRVGPRRVLLWCSLTSALFYVPYSLAESSGQIMIFQALTGASMGGMIAALSATMANLSPDGRQGAVYGLDTSVTSLANAIAPMMGAGLAVWAGLRATFLLTVVIFLCSSLFVARLIPKSPVSKPAPTSFELKQPQE
jgi:DHA1 family multidrug resistance protein-like MFS transporter